VIATRIGVLSAQRGLVIFGVVPSPRRPNPSWK